MLFSLHDSSLTASLSIWIFSVTSLFTLTTQDDVFVFRLLKALELCLKSMCVSRYFFAVKNSSQTSF